MKNPKTNYIILILLIIGLISYILLYKVPNLNSKELDDIRKENKEIQNIRDSLSKENIVLKEKAVEYTKYIENSNKTIDSLSYLIVAKDKEIDKTNNKIEASTKEYKILKEALKKLEDNPIIHKNDDLLNSLKEKTIE